MIVAMVNDVVPPMVVAPPSEPVTATVMAPGSIVPVNAYSINYFDDNKQVLEEFYKVPFFLVHHFLS